MAGNNTQKMRGNLQRLQIESATPGTFNTISALTNTAVSVTVAKVDTTNKDEAAFQGMLEGGGQKAVTITASGMVELDSDSQTLLKSKVLGSTNTMFRVIDEANNAYTGRFLVSKYDETGAVNGVLTYSITLDSDGVVTFGTVTP